MKILGPLHSADPQHWAAMPALLARVEQFCADYPTDLLYSQLREFILRNFWLTPPHTMGAILIVDDAGAVVGHTLGSIEARGTTKVGFVVQYQVDQHVPAEFRDELMQCLRDWARPHQVSALECITWLPPKVFERYGFTVHRTIMRATLEG